MLLGVSRILNWLQLRRLILVLAERSLRTYIVLMLQTNTLFEILKVLFIQSIQRHHLQFINVSWELNWRVLCRGCLIFWDTLHLTHEIFDWLAFSELMRRETATSLRLTLAILLFILRFLQYYVMKPLKWTFFVHVGLGSIFVRLWTFL